MIVKIKFPVITTFYFLFFLFFIGSGGTAETQQKIIDAAKREGEVMVYGILSSETANEMWGLFQKQYPFLRIKQYKATGQQLVNRFMIEVRAEKYIPDVLNLGDIEFQFLVDKGVVERFKPPQAESIPRNFKDPDGYWTAFQIFPFTIVYNNRLVSKEEAPQAWGDLLNPKWRGKIVMADADFQWYGQMLDYMGGEKGMRFMRALADQKPGVLPGSTLVLQQVAAGEYEVAIGRVQRAEILRNSGAPLGWSLSVNPMVAYYSKVGLAKNAPHPNAAKLLIDFHFSEVGQQVTAKWGRVPVRPGIAMSAGIEKLDLARIIPPNPDVFRKYNELTREYRNLFGGR